MNGRKRPNMDVQVVDLSFRSARWLSAIIMKPWPSNAPTSCPSTSSETIRDRRETVRKQKVSTSELHAI